MSDTNIIRSYIKRQRPAPRRLDLSRQESALLYNLLCDNARTWNAPLRQQLEQVVTPTDAFNAKRELDGRKD